MKFFLLFILSLSLTACNSKFTNKMGVEDSNSQTDDASLDLTIPDFNNLALGKMSSTEVSQYTQAFSAQDSDYVLPLPTSIAEVTCFALAVEWPEASKKDAQCKNSKGGYITPGLFQGLFAPGQKVDLKLPSGNGRKVYLLGYAATSLDECKELHTSKPLPKNKLSPPLVIGELSLDVTKGKNSVSISASLANAFTISECIGPKIDGSAVPAVPPAVNPPPTTPPVLVLPPVVTTPKSNSKSCSSTSSLNLANGQVACYGLWDFADSFGNDQHMCAKTGLSAYSASDIGCQINTSLCQSGKAQATKVMNIFSPWDSATDGISLASQAEVQTIASAISSTEDIVRKQIIRVWEYSCVASSSASPLAPIVGPTFASQSEIHMISIYTPSDIVNNEQGYATVNVLPGANKVILALTSYEPVQWTISGAANRVEKVILNGFHQQTSLGVDSRLIESHRYEQSSDFLGGININNDWIHDPLGVQSQAFAVKLQESLGAQVKSMQGQYEKNSFVIGDGLNLPPIFPAQSLTPHWVYFSNLSHPLSFKTAGAPLITFPIFVSNINHGGISVFINTEHITTSDADFTPVVNKVVEIENGSSETYVSIPIKTDGNNTARKTYKLKLSLKSGNGKVVTSELIGSIY